MWVYRSGKYHTDRVIILYEYQKTRKAEHPQKFLEEFHGVCECDAYAVYEKMVPEEGKTMKGVNYYLNHEKQFREFLNHGNVPLDNNATESALRNFCMHKHTWRLIDTINGAKASALVYSIVETAKANGLNPFRYLEIPADRNDGT